MPKRKSDTKSSEASNKKSLTDITGRDQDLGMKMTADKGCQIEKIEIIEQGFFGDEINHYFLLELIDSDLELSDVTTESVDCDQIDGFRETIRLLVEERFIEIKDSIKTDPARADNKKQKFIKALIRIFLIFLNPNLSSAIKITKIIKQSAKLVINL